MDYSKFSTEDLQAMQAGDISKVSTAGLKMMQGAVAPAVVPKTGADLIPTELGANLTLAPPAPTPFSLKGEGYDRAMKYTGLDGIGKQLRLTARHGLTGVGLGGIADIIGLPQPEGAQERVVGDAARNLASVSGIGKLAGYLAPAATKVSKKVLELLARNPGMQQTAAAGGGLAGGLTREGGGDQWDQLGATLAGSVVAPVAVAGVMAPARWAGRHLADISSTIGAGFGNQRGINRLTHEAALVKAGDARSQIVDDITNATTYIKGAEPTVADAIAQANLGQSARHGSDTVALQHALSRQSGYGDILRSAGDAQQMALQRPVELMAGGATQPQRIQAIADAIARKNAITGPMRDEVLMQANIGGIQTQRLQNMIGQRLAEASESVENVRRLGTAGEIATAYGHAGRPAIVEGGRPRLATEPFIPNEGGRMRLDEQMRGLPRLPGRYSYGQELAGIADEGTTAAAAKSLQRGSEARFAQMQLDSIEQSGFKVLDPSKITGHINKILNTPGDRAPTLNQKVLGQINAKIDEAVQMGGGRLDVRDLYAIRKTEINEIIANLTKDMDAATKTRAAGLVGTVKGQVDAAIEAAIGNTGKWSGPTGYLKTHAKLSNITDRMQVSGALLEKMGSDTGRMTPSNYLRALRSGEETLLRREGTPINKTMEQLYNPGQAKVLRGIEQHMARSAKSSQMAADVQGINIADLAAGGIPKPPTLLSRPMMIINYALKQISHDANTPVARELATRMQNPAEYAKLLALPDTDPMKIQAVDIMRMAMITATLQQQQDTSPKQNRLAELAR